MAALLPKPRPIAGKLLAMQGVYLSFVPETMVVTWVQLPDAIIGAGTVVVPMTLEQLGAALLAKLDKIISLLKPRRPVRLALALPIITRNGKIMANFELANDTVADILIVVDNGAGVMVPAIPGDVYTAVSSDPASMSAAIGTMPAPSPFVGSPSLHVAALVQLKSAVTATISDADGLKMFVETFDIVADTTPKSISLDLTNVVLTPQAVPPS